MSKLNRPTLSKVGAAPQDESLLPAPGPVSAEVAALANDPAPAPVLALDAIPAESAPAMVALVMQSTDANVEQHAIQIEVPISLSAMLEAMTRASTGAHQAALHSVLVDLQMTRHKANVAMNFEGLDEYALALLRAVAEL